MHSLEKIKKIVLEKEKNRQEVPLEERPELEKGDILAMLISGIITIGIPCALVVLAMALLMMIISGGF